MKVIEDNYNKLETCENCGSIFEYNEKDFIQLFPSSESKKKWIEYKERLKENVIMIYRNGKGIVCPLCGSIHVLKDPTVFLKKISK